MQKVGLTASVAVFGAVLWLGAGPAAQAQGVPSGGTRIGLVNMYHVMKNYKKSEMYEEEMKNMIKPYQEQATKLKKNYEGWKAVASDEKKSAKEREDALKYALEYEHQIKVLSAEWQKKIMTASDQHLVQLYREIEEAIQRCAKANGIQMVFQYFEPIDQAYTAKNVARKLNAGSVGAVAPIFFSPELDISQPVIQILNSQFPATAASTTTPGNH